MTCKGDKPALLPVNTGKMSAEQINRNAQPGGQTYREIMDIKDKSEREKALAKFEKEKGEGPEVLEENAQEDEEEEDETKEEDFSNGPIAPKYSLLHSYPMEMGQFLNSENPLENIKKDNIPKCLILKVELPAVEAVADLKCDVKADKLELSYADKYYLILEFGYLINENDSKAKFVAGKKMLKLTLPVLSKKQVTKIELQNPKIEKDEEKLGEEEEPKNDDLQEDDDDIKEDTTKPDTRNSEEQDDDDDIIDMTHISKKPETEKIENEENKENEIKLKPEAPHQDSTHKVEIENLQTNPEEPQDSNPEIPETPNSKNLNILEYKLTSSINTDNKWFYNVHIPDYKKDSVIFMYDENHLLLRYYDTERQVYFSFQTNNFNLRDCTIEHKMITDYNTIIVQFGSDEDQELFNKDVTLRDDLTEDEILSLEILLRSSKIEEEPEMEEIEKEEEVKVEDVQTEEKEEEIEEHVQTEEEKEVEVEKDEDDESEGQENGVRGVEENGKDQFGVQLIDFGLMDYVCELD